VKSEPLWIERDELLANHDELIAETGGAPGVRDVTLLDSALARPLDLFHYEDEGDLVRLAATYGVAVARNHPFVGREQAGCVHVPRPVSN
jgi:death-on-curing protein